jgi:hypothetical protein
MPSCYAIRAKNTQKLHRNSYVRSQLNRTNITWKFKDVHFVYECDSTHCESRKRDKMSSATLSCVDVWFVCVRTKHQVGGGVGGWRHAGEVVSVCPHVSIWESLNAFEWKLILESITKICWSNPFSIKVGQLQPFYTNTYEIFKMYLTIIC